MCPGEAERRAPAHTAQRTAGQKQPLVSRDPRDAGGARVRPPVRRRAARYGIRARPVARPAQRQWRRTIPRGRPLSRGLEPLGRGPAATPQAPARAHAESESLPPPRPRDRRRPRWFHGRDRAQPPQSPRGGVRATRGVLPESVHRSLQGSHASDGGARHAGAHDLRLLAVSRQAGHHAGGHPDSAPRHSAQARRADLHGRGREEPRARGPASWPSRVAARRTAGARARRARSVSRAGSTTACRACPPVS